MIGTASTSDRNANCGLPPDGTGAAAVAGENSVTLQTAYKLESMAKSVESFLVEQFRQLDALVAARPAPAASGSSSDVQRAELQRQQAAWERLKAEEYQRIEQERDLLGEAWTRVEAEQRRLLAEDALRRAQATTAREAAAAAPQGAAEQPDDQSIVSRREESGAARRAIRDTISRESALVEYEQLKNDVQKYARRLRRAT
jgi:hypothetical protein